MNKKILVIFLIAIITSLLIYKYKKNDEIEKVLFIGEKYYLNEIKETKFNKFLYDNITYKELIKRIKSNDYVVLKNKKIYLNQLIMNSDKILIGANNKEYNVVCNNTDVNKKYIYNKINNDKKELLKLLKRITSSKIVILNNNCK